MVYDTEALGTGSMRKERTRTLRSMDEDSIKRTAFKSSKTGEDK